MSGVLSVTINLFFRASGKLSARKIGKKYNFVSENCDFCQKVQNYGFWRTSSS